MHSTGKCCQWFIQGRKLLVSAWFTNILETSFVEKRNSKELYIYTHIHGIRFFLVNFLFFHILLFFLFFNTGKKWNIRGNVTEEFHVTLKYIFCHSNSCGELKSKPTEDTLKISCCHWTWIHDIHMEEFCLHKVSLDSFDCSWADYSWQRLFCFCIQYVVLFRSFDGLYIFFLNAEFAIFLMMLQEE